MTERDRGFVAYVVQLYPHLRKTFVLRDIEALRSKGLRVEVFSIKECDPGALQDDPPALAEMETTHYLAEHPLSFAAQWANLSVCFRAPLEVLRNVALALQGRGILDRLRHLVQVWRGALLARRIRAAGRCLHVHAQFADGAATTALAAARLLGVAFSFTSHTSWAPCALRAKLLAARFVASISNHDRRNLLQHVSQRKRAEVDAKIHIIHCGLPLRDWLFSPLDYQKLTKAQEVPVILSVGALEEKKGHDVLLRACHLLRAEGVSFRCRIVGPPAGADLTPLLRELNLEGNVKLLGPLPPHAVRRELLNCTVFALACRRTRDGNTDGVPVSLMEAMGIGRPVLSTNVAGVPELVIDGRTGFLAEPDDPQSLAHQLQVILKGGASIAATVDRARDHVVRSFSADEGATKLRALLEDSIHAP